MSEYGLFSDEGLVEGDFPDEITAEIAIKERYSPEDCLVVLECCHDHPDQPRRCCEECDAEEEQAEADEAEDDDAISGDDE